MAVGALKVHIGWRGPWDRIDEAVAVLRARKLSGKAILDVQRSGA